ncbi:DUF262 domain-containing protein [Romboutsia weinsteinii]|uniref:DUF262 domain-containing protein n=1 Tax=Romboutsia weinsteinii TaxID=2020949 RepID=A0A371IZ63_9FIRM|nr:DUF262 domain-containing protein [Romboutsia weinsteinii]RDY25769.1 DUF262 domain-containing protein [Romboutsia weinsteinii]
MKEIYVELNEDLIELDDDREEVLLKDKYENGQLRILRTSMDFPLKNLQDMLQDKDYLDINPSYQRRNRWDKRKKSLLIESLLMNIPIPPVFLFEKDYNSYEVMDGLQRLSTINEFLNNELRLSSLEYWTELNGKTFKDLPDIIKRGLLRRTVSAIVLLAESSREIDESDIRMVLFKRLNTGGIQLNQQELRNALYPGAFNNMIIDISKHDLFREVWGIPRYIEDEDENPIKELVENNLYKTMGDCEIILRFFAIREAYIKDKKSSLKRMLDLCVINHSGDTEGCLVGMKELYIDTLFALRNIFGDELFVLKKVDKLSTSLCDALMVAYTLVDNLADYSTIRESLDKQLNSKDGYEILTGKRGTSQSIIDRVILAKQILTGEI